MVTRVSEVRQLREKILACIEKVLDIELDYDDFDFDDHYWTVGFSDNLFREFLYELEDVFGVSGLEDLLTLNSTVNTTCRVLNHEFDLDEI